MQWTLLRFFAVAPEEARRKLPWGDLPKAGGMEEERGEEGRGKESQKKQQTIIHQLPFKISLYAFKVPGRREKGKQENLGPW